MTSICLILPLDRCHKYLDLVLKKLSFYNKVIAIVVHRFSEFFFQKMKLLNMIKRTFYKDPFLMLSVIFNA